MEKVQQTYRKPEELFVSNEVLNVIPGVEGVYHAQGNFKKNGSIDLSKEISEIFEEANMFFPDERYSTTDTRKTVPAPLSSLDEKSKKKLYHLFNGTTYVGSGYMPSQPIGGNFEDSYLLTKADKN